MSNLNQILTIMNKNKAITFGFVCSLLLNLSLLIITPPAIAHHPTGKQIPNNFTEGFLSGLGHPVIGIDHLVFLIGIGLLAAIGSKLGVIIPMAFTIATAFGTGIHLQSVDLPVPELIISASVLLIGIFLAKANQNNLVLVAIVSAIAGIFHGYAYGESIVGAEPMALGAYLLGFCAIQLGISAAVFYIGRLVLNKPTVSSDLPFRFAGFTICGISFSFLSSVISRGLAS